MVSVLRSHSRMCGIAGIVYRERARPVAEQQVRQMCDALRHRGPDDAGSYVSGSVGLGMQRLSIIDVSGSHQPIFNEDRSKLIVFNGEIYNYRELRQGLVARGHTLRSAGDTETVLHLFEEDGPACVERLRGMFAYAIWDAAASRGSLRRAQIATSTPSRANAKATALPIPALAPVTSAVFPFIWRSIKFPL